MIRSISSDDLTKMFDELQREGIYIGRHAFSLAGSATIESPAELPGGLIARDNLSIGAFSYSWSTIPSSVESVGRYCSIAGGVRFAELEHPTNWLSTSSFVYDRTWMWKRFSDKENVDISTLRVPDFRFSPTISIGNDVWVGSEAYIRGGVHLSDGCIVAARSVVTKDVPPYAVIAGNPGRIIKYRFSELQIARLLELKWWRYSFLEFPLDRINQVDFIIDLFEKRQANEHIPFFSPLCVRIDRAH